MPRKFVCLVDNSGTRRFQYLIAYTPNTNRINARGLEHVIGLVVDREVLFFRVLLIIFGLLVLYKSDISPNLSSILSVLLSNRLIR